MFIVALSNSPRMHKNWQSIDNNRFRTYFRSRGRTLQMIYSFRWNLQITGSKAKASATWAILLNPGKPNLVATTPNIAAITPRANSKSVTSMIQRHPVCSLSSGTRTSELQNVTRWSVSLYVHRIWKDELYRVLFFYAGWERFHENNVATFTPKKINLIFYFTYRKVNFYVERLLSGVSKLCKLTQSVALFLTGRNCSDQYLAF